MHILEEQFIGEQWLGTKALVLEPEYAVG